MTRPEPDFARYLAAKKSVDDRALNARVWERFGHELRALKPPARLLELGCGLGAMMERLLAGNFLTEVTLWGIDQDPDLIAGARRALAAWEPVRRLWEIDLVLEALDLDTFLQREAAQPQPAWNVILANAFLDLVDVPAVLPQLVSLLQPGGLFYFTINFDGATIFEPAIDPVFDALIEQLYHQTRDARQPRGGSRTGRKLPGWMRAAGVDVLAAGSSDWVVFADRQGRYPADEAYFLHYIVDTMAGALAGHPELDAARFAAWIERRHEQINAGILTYIAHQIDILARRGDGKKTGES